MVKPMKNKVVIYLTIIGIILIIAIPTYLKVNEQHQERLRLVAEKAILESAMECFNESVCSGTEVTIQELQEKGFMKEEIVNPKTKEYYPSSTRIQKNKNEYILIV